MREIGSKYHISECYLGEDGVRTNEPIGEVRVNLLVIWISGAIVLLAVEWAAGTHAWSVSLDAFESRLTQSKRVSKPAVDR